MPTPFSVVIITRNEEANIARCLASVHHLTDDIVIMDGQSTDNTIAICSSYPNVRVIQRVWEGYSATKNVGNQHAKHHWILSLDADEEVSDKLQAALAIAMDSPNAKAFLIRRLNNYAGKWIVYGGWNPEFRIRLFDKRVAHWDGKAVHEDITFIEPTSLGKLHQPIHHYSYTSVFQHVEKLNRYSEHAALEMLEKGKKAGVLKLVFAPMFAFFRDYLLKRGFLDGFEGFLIAQQSAYYTFLKYAKLTFLNARQTPKP